MKKAIIIFLSCILIFSLYGCAEKNELDSSVVTLKRGNDEFAPDIPANAGKQEAEAPADKQEPPTPTPEAPKTPVVLITIPAETAEDESIMQYLRNQVMPDSKTETTQDEDGRYTFAVSEPDYAKQLTKLDEELNRRIETTTKNIESVTDIIPSNDYNRFNVTLTSADKLTKELRSELLPELKTMADLFHILHQDTEHMSSYQVNFLAPGNELITSTTIETK